MNDATPAEEAEALRRIGGRWRFILRGIHASPLESPCEGSSSFRDAVQRLRESALVWPAFDHQAIGESNVARLDRIEAVADQVLCHFDSMRFKEPPALTLDMQGFAQSSGWAETLCIAPRAHQWAKDTFFAMHSTSRPALEEGTPPSIAALCDSGFYAAPPPLRDVHLAAVAALVCLARALYALDDVLSHWRWAVAQAAPALHFDGRAGAAEWVDAISAARLDARLLGYEAECLSSASVRIAQAEGWLGCAEQTMAAEKMARGAADSAKASEHDAQRKRRSAAARKTLDVPKATSVKNRLAVKRAAESIGVTTPPPELTALVMERTGQSAPTVRGHLRALGFIPQILRK